MLYNLYSHACVFISLFASSLCNEKYFYTKHTKILESYMFYMHSTVSLSHTCLHSHHTLSFYSTCFLHVIGIESRQ
jgi:hypothetical protein